MICGAAMGYTTRWLQLGLEKRPRMHSAFPPYLCPVRRSVTELATDQWTHLAYALVFAIAGSSAYNFNAKNETLLYRRLTALSERHEAERAYALRKAEADGAEAA
jgi:hypothetical protein